MEITRVRDVGPGKNPHGVDARMIYSPAKIVHCWYNELDEPLKVLVVKTPRQKQTVIL